MKKKLRRKTPEGETRRIMSQTGTPASRKNQHAKRKENKALP